MVLGFDSLGVSREELIDNVREINESQNLRLHMQNFPSEILEGLKAPYVDSLQDPKLRRYLDAAYQAPH